jgi:N6-adenosine-specific RNA methylase IME4
LQDAIEIKMEAERRGGRLLIVMAESGQRHSGRGHVKRVGLRSVTPRPEPKLSDLGVSKTESSRWQAVARLSADKWSSKKRHVKGIAIASLEGDMEVVRAARAERHRSKRAQRSQRERNMGETQLALPEKKYGVILEDPEWRFEFWSEKGKTNSSADNHYSTSSLEIIKSRDVGSIAADDCVLFLWVTVPLLPVGIEVMEARGFTYKTNFNWHKNKAGTGYWNRNKHEHLLVGTRGKIPAPAEGDQWESSLEAAVRKHSEKPELFYEMIEAYFPTLPKIELNARKARKGWDRWGDQAPQAEAAE